MATFNQANVTNGVYKAAQAKFKRDQDYQGAKSSWIKWFALQGDLVVYNLFKEKWLFLAEIYVGEGDTARAKQAIAWAENTASAEPPIPGVDQQTGEAPNKIWADQVSEVKRQIGLI